MPNFEQKQEVINEIKGKIDKAVSVVLVDARGLTVAQDTDFRRKLREGGIDYKVYKNTMMDFAIKDTPYEGLAEYLKGPSAMALSYDDATKAARIINKAAKDYKKLEFKAGVVENVLYDANGIKAVAEIPPREELISKLLGSFKSPLSSFVRVINQIAEKGGDVPVEAKEEAPAVEAAAEPAAAEPEKETVAEKAEEPASEAAEAEAPAAPAE